jgi:D-proline reductase (dithiol) PrdB
MDKSREYYGAQGYERAYEWAHHADVPFTPLIKPLTECQVGVVTTADRGPRDADRGNMLFAVPHEETIALERETFWDRTATHTDDRESYLPLNALLHSAARGQIGSVSPRVYGATTDYSQRRVNTIDAPQIEQWMVEDDVDVAILVAL